MVRPEQLSGVFNGAARQERARGGFAVRFEKTPYLPTQLRVSGASNIQSGGALAFGESTKLFKQLTGLLVFRRRH
jgi:hypothetical protein